MLIPINIVVYNFTNEKQKSRAEKSVAVGKPLYVYYEDSCLISYYFQECYFVCDLIDLIKMNTKKYGVSLSALKSLQDFQRSLNTNKKIFAMPFQVECLFSINNEEPFRCVLVADSGLVSSDVFGVIYLKNRVESSSETDTTVVLHGKGRAKLFDTMFIQFDNKDDKAGFMTSIQNVPSSDSDDRSSNT